MNDLPPDPPSLDILSPSSSPSSSLMKAFVSSHNTIVFRRMFKALWRYLWPVSRVAAISHSYAVKAVLKKMQPVLTISHFYILGRLYLVSAGGSLTIDSRRIKLRSYESVCITDLCRHKLMHRTCFDPLHARLSSHRSTQKVFVSFTPAGIAFYRGVLRRVREYVMHDAMSYQQHV